MEILLNKYKNVNSVNLEIKNKLALDSTNQNINEFNLHEIVDAAAVFDNERQNNAIYRIYGKIEYMSILNGLKKNYNELKDFFIINKINSKNIFNSFDFYLVIPSGPKPTNSDSLYSNIPYTDRYRREFKVIATPNNIEIYKAGFSKNIFGEQEYCFNLNIDVDINDIYDGFNFPITDVYLFPVYKASVTNTLVENVSATIWNNHNVKSTINLGTPTYNIGDTLTTINDINIGDIVTYNKNNYIQNIDDNQIFYIDTPYYDTISNSEKILRWKYNPFIELKLRYLSNQKYEINSGGTNYNKIMDIPLHATNIIDDIFVWRNIQKEGVYNPLTGDGNDLPFINGKRYYFKPIIFDINPDLSHNNTFSVFSDIWFTNNSIVNNILPNNNLNDFGKPCK